MTGDITEPAGAPTGGVSRTTLDPFGTAFLQDPYAHHEELRACGPVFWIEQYGIYGMACFKEVSTALRDWRTFGSGRGVGLADFARETPWRPPSLLLEVDPPIHDRTRNVVKSVLSLDAIHRQAPAWRRKAEELADMLVARRRFDAVMDLGEVYPLLVFPDAVGIRQEGREHLVVYAAAIFNAFGPRNALFEEANAAARDAIQWVAESCERDQLTPGSWGAQIYEAADRGDCSPDEAARLVRSFLSAGIDTTINGVGNMMYALATHPDQWALLKREPDFVKRAFDESLRWLSTAQTFFRTTTCAVNVAGHEIPEGSKVLLFLAAANRDPAVWEGAERFEIARPARAHLGFGFGIHQCIGQIIARQEAELVAAALMSRVKAVRLADEPKRRLNNTLFAFSSLPVEVDPL